MLRRAVAATGLACVSASTAWALPRPLDEPPATNLTIEDQVNGKSARVTVIVRNEQSDGQQKEDGQADGKQKASERKEGAAGDQKVTVEVEAQAAPAKRWLGVALEPIEGALARYLGNDRGVLVDSVYADSPAEKAQLKEGDIIVSFHGKEIEGPASLVSVLRQLDTTAEKEGEAAASPEVEIKVLRRGEMMTLKITPTVRPASVKQQANIEINVPELKEMALRGGSIVKFGNPVVVPELARAKAANFTLVQNEDGKTKEVRIESRGDGAPKITLTDEQGQREIKADELDALPEKLRKVVQQTLERMSQSEKQLNESSAKQTEKAAAAAALAASAMERAHQKMEEARQKLEGKVNGKVIERVVETDAAKAAEKAANLESQIREQIEQALKQFHGSKVTSDGGVNGVVLITPEWAQDMQKSAEKLAQEGLKKAGQFAAMPEKIAELQEKIDLLQKQVEQLTRKLEERGDSESKK